MKKKQRFLKLIAVVTVVMILALSLISCSVGGTSVANDASGELGSLKWSYVKDGQTLTISGSGAMTNFTGTDDVAWADVASSVKKVVIGSGVTNIADYAFFGMSALTEVQISSTVVTIGKLSFAYTTSLESIAIPNNVTSIGYGAFETSGVKTVVLSANITSIPERAFIYCNKLTSLTGAGVKTIGNEAFAYCSALTSLRLSDSFESAADSAFSEASMTKDKITVADDKITITYRFVDVNDNEKTIAPNKEERVTANSEPYFYAVPAVEGYTPVATEVPVTPGNMDQTVVVTYTKNEVETEVDTSADTTVAPNDDDGKIEPMTIVALVVTVIIIIGIIVGTVLFIRHDKKNSGSRTVRKDKNGKNGKKDKK